MKATKFPDHLHRPIPLAVLHPVTRLLLWLLLSIAIQSLEGGLLALAFAVLPLLGRPVLRRGGRLIWRARWLLLSLFVIFAWGMVGEPVWDGMASPSREGLSEALTHLGRLLLLLLAVAALLEFMPMSDLLIASRHLLQPLRRFGLDGERGAVRLMLVLRYVETLPRPRDWRQLLAVPDVCESERIELDDRPLRRADKLLLLAAYGSITAFLVARSMG
jgi:energy-coupling factor transporter transmembrane protein EcfT